MLKGSSPLHKQDTIPSLKINNRTLYLICIFIHHRTVLALKPSFHIKAVTLPKPLDDFLLWFTQPWLQAPYLLALSGPYFVFKLWTTEIHCASSLWWISPWWWKAQASISYCLLTCSIMEMSLMSLCYPNWTLKCSKSKRKNVFNFHD